MNYTLINGITLMPTTHLRANTWNPNEMTETEFQELTTEVRRLGRIPKPIVVRPQGELYEIIDGEHNWLAAQEVGLTELPCEIIEADDFEARFQTFKRNQHGRHSPVLEGRMFREMCDETGSPYTELAKQMGISEGTVRNRLSYAHAAILRNGYAGENRDVEIDGLQIRQVRIYAGLPQPLRDLWLDAGAHIDLLGKYAACSHYRHVGLLLDRYGLLEHFDPNEFRDSFARLGGLAEWLERNEDMPGVGDYVQAIAANRLPDLLVCVIPIRQRAGAHEICLGLEDWTEILQEVSGRTGGPDDVTVEAASAVYERLEDLGVDPGEVFDGLFKAHIETLLETSGFIREAHSLTLEERVQLHFARSPAPPDITDRAKRDTIAFLREERSTVAAIGTEHGKGPKYVLGVFIGKLRTGMEADGIPIEPRNFDRDHLLQSFDSLPRWCPHLRDVTVAGRPALEIFRDRMAKLKTPELVVVRALLDGAIPTLAIGEWMDAVHEETTIQSTASPCVAESDAEPEPSE